MIIRAHSYDYQLREILSGGTRRLKIHSVFESAFNVEAGGGRLLTFYISIFNQPGAAVIEKIPKGLKPGAGISAGWPEISLENWTIDLSGAKEWRENFPEPDSGAGCAETADEFKKKKAAAAEVIFGATYRALKESFAGKGIEKIVGTGEGLTPAGDDMLVGVLNSLFFESRVFTGTSSAGEFNKLASGISKNLNRTNDISASFYKFALDGRLGEQAMNLLNALYTCADLNEIMDAAEAFFRWGATSGKYHLLGLLDFHGDF